MMDTIDTNIDIPGILVLNGNKVYGTYGSSKKKKHLYKFIPNDSSFPYFLVPYMIPPSFSKQYVNKYVVIRFKEWHEQNQTNKRPIGLLVVNIGDVHINENTYEYLMYCNHIKHSNKPLQLALKDCLRRKSRAEWIETIISRYDMEDRRPTTTLTKDGFKYDIYSMDPIGSKDIDDAFSVRKVSRNEYVLSVYIANVTIWMEVMGLWNYVSRRVSTVYLPDEKIPMLPNAFSDDLCSLIQDETRFAFCMDITLTTQDETDHIDISNVSYKNVIVKLCDNVNYDDQSFLSSDTYQTIFRLTSLMNKDERNGIRYMKTGIKDSHDVVQYLMLFMNCRLASWCRDRHIGIYRVLPNTICEKELDDVDQEIKPFLEIWNNVSGLYTTQKNMTTSYNELYKLKDLSHHRIGTNSYMHTTSPIRRLVDLLNMSIIQKRMGMLEVKGDIDSVSLVDSFYIDHTTRDELNYINKQNRHIRHVQNESRLIHMVTSDPDILNCSHKGYIVDVVVKKDKMRYTIYIEALRLLKQMDVHYMEEDPGMESKIQTDPLILYNSYYFKLSVFKDSHFIKRKIRINLHKENTI